jgi:predicted permease
MSDIVLAILPVFLLIFLGTGLKAAGILAPAFWEGAERLTYFLLFPALLVTTLAGARFGELAVLPMSAAICAAVLIMAAGLLVAKPWLAMGGGAFTSLFQGSIRFNTYIGLAAAAGVFGTAGLAAAAVAVALLVPLGNLLSVAALAWHAGKGRPRAREVLRQLALNPLILASALGIALNLGGRALPPVIDPLLTVLGRGALPLGLLAVGAGLDFAAARRGGRTLALACLLKLAVLPALTALGCWVFGAGGVAAGVAVLFNALPTAPSAYILARRMGGEARLMASIITAQVALSALTLPLILIAVN